MPLGQVGSFQEGGSVSASFLELPFEQRQEWSKELSYMEILGESILVSGNSKCKDHRRKELGDSGIHSKARVGAQRWSLTQPGWGLAPWKERVAGLRPQRIYSETREHRNLESDSLGSHACSSRTSSV